MYGKFRASVLLSVLGVAVFCCCFASIAFAQAASPIVPSGDGLYYVATDGTIHQDYMSNSSWVDFNVMAGTGTSARVAPGTTVVTAPTGLWYTATDGTAHQDYVSNDSWVDFNLMAGTGTSARVATGTSIVPAGSGLYYVATDGTIHQDYVSNDSWVDFNVTAGTGTSARVAPGTTVLTASTGLWCTATDGTIHEDYVSNDSWVDFNVTGDTGTSARVATGTSVLPSGDGLYYVATDGTIHQDYVSNNSWVDFNVMAGTGTSARVAPGTPVVTAPTGLWYTATDGTAHQDYVSNNSWVDFNVTTATGTSARVARNIVISGQVAAGASGLSGVTVNLTGTTGAGTSVSLSATTDSNGDYSFSVPAGGNYTIVPSLAGYVFSPGSQQFSNVGGNQTANFSLVSTPGDSNPDPSPVSYPYALGSASPPGWGPENGNDISGTWTDSASNTWSLQAGSGGLVGGTYSSTNPACGTTITWAVSGSGAGVQYNTSASNPNPPTACNEFNPTLALAWTSTSDVTATANVTLTAPAGYYFASTGTNTESGGTITLTRPSAPAYTLTSQSQMTIPGTNDAQMVAMSTGDSLPITTTASVSFHPVSVSYSWETETNPDSDCQTTISIPQGSGTGSATSNVTASPANCSGVYSVVGTVGGTTTNPLTIVVPPQILIQMLYGEAHGQAAIGDTVSEQAIGATVRNRFGDRMYFPGVNTYQDAITASQFDSINRCQAAGTCVQNGTTPELSNAALLFGGVTTAAMNVDNAKCFFSPDGNGWSAIQNALGNSKITIVPTVTGDPACFSYYVNGQLHKENEQFIYKASVGNNASGSGAPAFIFVQWKKSSDPAVIQIP